MEVPVNPDAVAALSRILDRCDLQIARRAGVIEGLSFILTVVRRSDRRMKVVVRHVPQVSIDKSRVDPLAEELRRLLLTLDIEVFDATAQP